jgi:hypothetical protein
MRDAPRTSTSRHRPWAPACQPACFRLPAPHNHGPPSRLGGLLAPCSHPREQAAPNLDVVELSRMFRSTAEDLSIRACCVQLRATAHSRTAQAAQAPAPLRVRVAARDLYILPMLLTPRFAPPKKTDENFSQHRTCWMSPLILACSLLALRILMRQLSCSLEYQVCTGIFHDVQRRARARRSRGAVDTRLRACWAASSAAHSGCAPASVWSPSHTDDSSSVYSLVHSAPNR